MRTKLSILAAAIALPALTVGSSVATASRSETPATTVKLQKALDAVVATGVPGALVVVRDGNRNVRLASGYSNLAPKTPMRASDRFRIGSETTRDRQTAVPACPAAPVFWHLRGRRADPRPRRARPDPTSVSVLSRTPATGKIRWASEPRSS